MGRIVLTGTTGRLGSAVLRTILAQNLIPPSDLIISLYNPAAAPHEAKAAGITIRRGDFGDTSSLRAAFAGAEALFLVSYPGFSGPGYVEKRIAMHANAIAAAKDTGVRRVVYTSLCLGGVSGESSVGVVMQSHIGTIKILKESGLEYTVVREGTYAEMWSVYAGFVKLDGKDSTEALEIVVPADVAPRFVSREDLGEATAKILANLDQYKNTTVALQGPYATSVSGIAELVRRHTQRQVNLRILSGDECVAYHLKNQTLGPSTTELFLRDWLTFFDAIGVGEDDYVDETITTLLGRRPRGLLELAEELFGTTAQ